MMHKKALVGMMVLGSLWGVLECTVGDVLHDTQFPAGVIMTGLVAVGLMVLSRLIFKQPGMQLGMGMIAGALRLMNPFTGCFICSAIAIMAEGALFEVLWYKLIDAKELRKPMVSISMGVVTAYVCFVSGYMITQTLTPLLTSAGFNPANLIAFIPQILAEGLWAALIGGIVVPVALFLKQVNILKLKDRNYYPTAAVVTAVCWIIVIADTLLILA